MGFFNSLPNKFHLFLLSLGLFAHFLASLVGGHSTVYVEQTLPVPTAIVASTSTSAVKTNIATSTVKTKVLVQIQSTVPTQKPSAATVVVQATGSPTEALPQTQDTATVQASAQEVESLNTIARSALVNILCTTATGGSFNPISGSGILVDNRGVILTNAHVAQYFLLRDYPFPNNIQCVIRTGSPASPQYTAEVMYLPSEWVAANAAQIIAQHPLGTGENDYAFLRITGTVSPAITLPASFPALPMTSAAPEVGAPVLLAAYPAGLLDGQTIQQNLYSSSAVSIVKNLYSFDGLSHVDLISLGGTVVSQTGSSGGALVGLGSSKLLGVIATETTGTTTADRQLNAVTVGFIDRSLSKAGKGGLYSFLTGDIAQKTTDFEANVAPQETAQLEAALKKTSN
jgi:hypothetical protein